MAHLLQALVWSEVEVELVFSFLHLPGGPRGEASKSMVEPYVLAAPLWPYLSWSRAGVQLPTPSWWTRWWVNTCLGLGSYAR